MIRTGLIGKFETSEKYTGIIHQLEGCTTAGVCDSRKNEPPYRHKKRGDRIFDDPGKLTESADAVIFTSTDGQTFDIMKEIIKDGRHLLIYPDPDLPFKKLESLRKTAEEAGVLFYMARHLHHGSLLENAGELLSSPQFLCVCRSGRLEEETGLVPLNHILYHEIISQLSVIHSPLRKYSLSTVPVHSQEPLLINIRMEFSNGSTAILTINFFSRENYRTTEVFSPNAMVRYDTRSRVIEISGNPVSRFPVSFRKKKISENFILSEDIGRFLKLIREKAYPSDQYNSGIITHKIAEEIIFKLTPVKNNR